MSGTGPPDFNEGETRSRLLRAAAHLFARVGIDAVKNHDIHALAGQRNESAIHYHFGNRANLLTAIIEEAPPPGIYSRPQGGPMPTSLEGFLEALACNLAIGLETPGGRDWLRIVSQLMGRYPKLSVASVLASGPPYVVAVLQTLLPELSPEVVERRTMIVLQFMTAQFAERAKNLDDGGGSAVPAHEGEFLEELVGMCVGMLTTKAPGRPRRRRRGVGRQLTRR